MIKASTAVNHDIQETPVYCIKSFENNANLFTHNTSDTFGFEKPDDPNRRYYETTPPWFHCT